MLPYLVRKSATFLKLLLPQQFFTTRRREPKITKVLPPLAVTPPAAVKKSKKKRSINKISPVGKVQTRRSNEYMLNLDIYCYGPKFVPTTDPFGDFVAFHQQERKVQLLLKKLKKVFGAKVEKRSSKKNKVEKKQKQRRLARRLRSSSIESNQMMNVTEQPLPRFEISVAATATSSNTPSSSISLLTAPVTPVNESAPPTVFRIGSPCLYTGRNRKLRGPDSKWAIPNFDPSLPCSYYCDDDKDKAECMESHMIMKDEIEYVAFSETIEPFPQMKWSDTAHYQTYFEIQQGYYRRRSALDQELRETCVTDIEMQDVGNGHSVLEQIDMELETNNRNHDVVVAQPFATPQPVPVMFPTHDNAMSDVTAAASSNLVAAPVTPCIDMANTESTNATAPIRASPAFPVPVVPAAYINTSTFALPNVSGSTFNIPSLSTNSAEGCQPKSKPNFGAAAQPPATAVQQNSGHIFKVPALSVEKTVRGLQQPPPIVATTTTSTPITTPPPTTGSATFTIPSLPNASRGVQRPKPVVASATTASPAMSTTPTNTPPQSISSMMHTVTALPLPNAARGVQRPKPVTTNNDGSSNTISTTQQNSSKTFNIPMLPIANSARGVQRPKPAATATNVASTVTSPQQMGNATLALSTPPPSPNAAHNMQRPNAGMAATTIPAVTGDTPHTIAGNTFSIPVFPPPSSSKGCQPKAKAAIIKPQPVTMGVPPPPGARKAIPMVLSFAKPGPDVMDTDVGDKPSVDLTVNKQKVSKNPVYDVSTEKMLKDAYDAPLPDSPTSSPSSLPQNCATNKLNDSMMVDIDTPCPAPRARSMQPKAEVSTKKVQRKASKEQEEIDEATTFQPKTWDRSQVKAEERRTWKKQSAPAGWGTENDEALSLEGEHDTDLMRMQELLANINKGHPNRAVIEKIMQPVIDGCLGRVSLEVPIDVKHVKSIQKLAEAGPGSTVEPFRPETSVPVPQNKLDAFEDDIIKLQLEEPKVWEWLIGFIIQKGYTLQDLLVTRTIEEAGGQKIIEEDAEIFIYVLGKYAQWSIDWRRVDDRAAKYKHNMFVKTEEYYEATDLTGVLRADLTCIMRMIESEGYFETFADQVKQWALQKKDEFIRIARKAGLCEERELERMEAVKKWLWAVTADEHESFLTNMEECMQFRYPHWYERYGENETAEDEDAHM